MDTVFIEGLRVDAKIGVYGWERNIRQPLIFDLQMSFDLKQAGLSDDVADALDYGAVSELVVVLVEASDFQLIEAVAEKVMEQLFQSFAMTEIDLTLRKPTAVRKAQAVGIRLKRSRQDYV